MKLKGPVHKAFQFDNVLTEKECAKYRKYIDSYTNKDHPTVQSIEDDRKIARKIFKKLKPFLVTLKQEELKFSKCSCKYKLEDCADFVTITKGKSAIKIHIDESEKDKCDGKWDHGYDCIYKVAIYLNDLSDPNNEEDFTGGTAFYDKYGEKCVAKVKPKIGRAFMFNLADYHSGVAFPQDKLKYLIGIRLLYSKVKE